MFASGGSGCVPQRPAAARGFTLIEMLVLIIIMVVLSTAVVPVYSRLRDRSAFDAYMGDLTGFFSQMRAVAVEEGCDVRVTYDPQSDTFSAVAETGDISGDVPTSFAAAGEGAPTVFERVFSLPADFAISDLEVFGPEVYLNASGAAGASVIVFREDGTCDGLRFTVVRDTGASATVTLWPSTGLVEVESADVSGTSGYSGTWSR